MKTRRLGGAALALAVVAGCLSAPGTAYGATVVPCDPLVLKNAIATAASGATLSLTAGCVYDYTDATKAVSDSALPHITKALTIVGNGATIQRDPISFTQFRVMSIDAPGNVTLSSATIQFGFAPTNLNGGGVQIVNTGAKLKATNVVVTDNAATQGGGIWVGGGTLSFSGGRIDANSGLTVGGGLAVVTATATLNNTSVVNNFVGNGVVANGGGIGILNPSIVSLSGVHVNNNSGYGASGGAGRGGGIFNGNASGTLQVASSTVQFNRTKGSGGGGLGGGIFNDGTLKFSSSHLDYNTAGDVAAGSGKGGGLYNENGTATIGSSTVTHDEADGPHADGGGILAVPGTVTISNILFASNIPNNCGNPSTVTGCT